MKYFLMVASGAASLSFGAFEPADYSNLSVDVMPPVQLVVKEAGKASTSGQVDVEAERKRIRNSYLLPEVTFQFGATSRPYYEYGFNELTKEYNYGETNRNYTQVDQDYYTTGTSDKFYPQWYAQVEWELNKLVIDREVLYLSEVTARSISYKERTMDNVVDVYKELMTLLVDKKDLGSDPALERDIAASAAELDFLTGNYLAKTLRARDIQEAAVAKASKEDAEARAKEREARRKQEQQAASELDPQRDPNSPLYELGDDMPDSE